MIFLQSAPHLMLEPYIGQYIYTSSNTNLLPSLKQIFPPYDIPAISFFIEPVFAEPTNNVTFHTPANNNPSSYAYFNALATAPSTLCFKENSLIKAFIISFKPSGFSSLFKRDMSELTNTLPDLLLLAGASEGSRLLEQLAEAKEFAVQVRVLDDFFMKRIPGSYHSEEQIRDACRTLILTAGLINMNELAYRSNLSLRTLERHFTQRVGVAPKTFARIKRFHHALSLMNRQEPPPWSDISFNCGYYDQSHFIKEFRIFSNNSPSSYTPKEYFLYNQIILSRNFSVF